MVVLRLTPMGKLKGWWLRTHHTSFGAEGYWYSLRGCVSLTRYDRDGGRAFELLTVIG